MSDEKQHRIRQRAHAIWERQGRPDGAEHDHWHQASQEIDAEDAAPKKPASRAKPAAAKVTKAAAPKAPAKAPAAKKPAAKAK